eukprot:TRINITY_DN2367_c0_g4_i2.p1 TRINITY_DN2367_c0_g4~~TRINITY_DN2367_c0_g4_i2.p1  ORF type:complete len:118 (-),score=43.22 TRINITY_DN2367_c0_g4_i2:134-487(-)
MNVLLPKMKEDGSTSECKPMKREDHLAYKFRCGDTEGMMSLINKPPTWNNEIKAYVLDFYGRITQPSIKNFQLINPSNENEIVMQFGRVDDDLFNMDISWPLSVLQAFGISISAFDY